ncbi:hypothetical protein FKP32DRAFT_1570640 [Trametes sanguinea]|nr:hypothetical protein FKP32DRAFT_1570640 [Trametes sanguinea]
MSSIPRRLDPRYPQPERQPSRDSLRSLGARSDRAPSYMSQGDDDTDSLYQHDRLPSSPAKLDIELPESNLDLTMDFNSIMAAQAEGQKSEEMDKVQKRASNVMKLAEQNERLKAELRAMTERLEAAERRQRELAQAQAKGQTQGQGQSQGATEGGGSAH